MIDLIIPSRTDSLLRLCLGSLLAREPAWGQHGRITVVDSGLSESYVKFLQQKYNARVLPYSSETASEARYGKLGPGGSFCFARAINLAARATTGDLFLLNDDARFTTFEPLMNAVSLVALMQDTMGLMAARIESGGVGNPEQRLLPEDDRGWQRPMRGTVCFIGVLIPRSVWEVVGELDERFDGYGWEDNDYSWRALQAGYSNHVTSLIALAHGSPSRPESSSYRAYMTPAQLSVASQRARRKFVEKWGTIGPDPPFERPT